MPFQWGYSAAHSLIRSEFFGEVSLFSGELALPKCGRDRVSRFIGKSDTTARGPRLQVTCEVRFATAGTKAALFQFGFSPKSQSATPIGVALRFLRRSLASRNYCKRYTLPLLQQTARPVIPF